MNSARVRASAATSTQADNVSRSVVASIRATTSAGNSIVRRRSWRKMTSRELFHLAGIFEER